MTTRRPLTPAGSGESRPDLVKELREVRFLYQTSQVLTATLDLDSVLPSLMAQVKDYFRVEAVSAALLDDDTGELVFRVAVGEAADSVVGARMAASQGIAGWVLKTGDSVLVSDVQTDHRWHAAIDEQTGFRTRTVLAVPIVVDGHVIGVIEALNPTDDVFDEEACRLLSAVANIAAVAIRNAKLYQRALQAESRYENLFDSSTNVVVVLDLAYVILDLNRRAQELFAQPRGQLIGADFWGLLGLSPREIHSILDAVAERDPYSLQVTIESRGEVHTIESQFAQVSYGPRDAIQWVGHDVSERVALERLREDMTHTIVHDLRNPLSSIMSSLQLIRTAIVEHDETLPIMQLLRIGLLSSQKMLRLIDSLLDLGRFEAGDTELSRALVHPQELLDEAIEQIRPLAIRRQQAIDVQDVTHLSHVFVERDIIVRVLANLLDNAVKFTPKAGRISVCVDRQGKEVVFTVSDTGQGIAPENHERIFERFVRVNTGEPVRGSGLGLAFCKVAVEAHGGRIWVESEPGLGANFHFTLPLEAE
ncbi:MAG: GAF domain-containing sensor histidine kinase [Chloroflexi bacterium]|nr:GAF domain-containing sensor histidine kinase [Chloroflexota bacterium]